jgi:hypothetical protein
MTIVDLSAFPTLQPQPPEDLCRIGSEFDGGYVVSRYAISESKHLLSFGISYDVNFEYDFVNSDLNSKSAYMYDASTKPFSPEHIFSIIINCLRFVSHRPVMHYLAFLKRRKNLLSSGCAFLDVNVSDSENNRCITLTKALIEITKKQERNIFLKVDIEGDEILLLPEIILNIEYLSGIVLEFHRASALWDLIISFIGSLRDNGLYLDHLHINNYGGLSPRQLPNVIELSFSRSPRHGKKSHQLPIPSLDAPNSPLRADYDVNF